MRKMSLCFLLNARTFCFKHLCVLSQTPLCFALNAFVFCFKLRCTENSCQFENLFLTKLTG